MDWPWSEKRYSVNASTAPYKIAVLECTPAAQLQDTARTQLTPVTMVLAQAVYLPKECWYPSMRGILQNQAVVNGWYIERFVLFDHRNHADSALLNSEQYSPYKSVDEVPESTKFCWFDAARDLNCVIGSLNLCNQSGRRSKVVGMGGSMGAAILVLAEAMRPSTFDALVMLDPGCSPFTILEVPDPTFRAAVFALHRKSKWPSKQAALEYINKNRFYLRWTQTARDLFVEYGTHVVKSADGTETVELKTLPLQEAMAYIGGGMSSNAAFWFVQKQLALPKLMVHSKTSDFIPVEDGRELVRMCMNTTGAEIDKGGHLMALNTPDEVAEVTSRFLTATFAADSIKSQL
ncbi:alpha/beta-hydrolase [Ramicandelaber brevisporus]|nr:alpha/beta-hydrolase [Ramicandelaber brevisporus]